MFLFISILVIGINFKMDLIIKVLFLVISCLSSLDLVSAGNNPAHYALDPQMTRKLAKMEEGMAITLTELWNWAVERDEKYEENKCLQKVCKYIDEFEEDDDALGATNGARAADIVSQNPILIFKLIKRMYVSLIEDTVPICSGDREYRNVLNIMKEAFTKNKLEPVAEQDWHDAQLGILRIQYVYGFNATSHLRLGIFRDVETKAYLNFEDCLILANKAIDLKADTLAYQWIISAQLAMEEEKFSSHISRKDIESNLERTLKRLKNLAKIETKDDFQTKLKDKKQLFMDGFSEYERFASCRGESTMHPMLQAQLKCFNQDYWHPYFFINPVKTEVLSPEPLVLQFYDFVGNKAINFIKGLTMKNMIRSGIASGQMRNKMHYADTRTSLTSIYDDERDPRYPQPVVKKLLRKIEILTGMEIVKKRASDLQFVMYGAMGGHYNFHHDALQDGNEVLDMEGNRAATFLMFTSNVQMGGYTGFYKLGIFARPIKGSAVFWYNIDQYMRKNKMMLHGGCPVILGYKDVANLWMYQYENMFSYPCTVPPFMRHGGDWTQPLLQKFMEEERKREFMQ